MATILAALLHDAPPQGLGPVRCVALGPAAVLSAELAEAAAPFTTSVILGRAPPRGWQLRCRPVLVKGELCMIAAPRLAAGPLRCRPRALSKSELCMAAAEPAEPHRPAFAFFPRMRLLRSCDNGAGHAARMRVLYCDIVCRLSVPIS